MNKNVGQMADIPEGDRDLILSALNKVAFKLEKEQKLIKKSIPCKCGCGKYSLSSEFYTLACALRFKASQT